MNEEVHKHVLKVLGIGIVIAYIAAVSYTFISCPGF